MEMVRSGNRADERCRVERRAHGRPWRPSPRKEARPSQLTGDRVGLGTRRRRTQGALPLSYARPGLMWMWCRAAGFEPATTRLRGEGTPACASGRLGCGASSFGCEARIRTRISWFRARRGAGCTESRANRSEAEVRPGTTSHRSGWRDSNSQPPAPRAGALPLRHIQLVLLARPASTQFGPAARAPLRGGVFRNSGTDGRIRTDTDGGLSAVPLPVGLRQQWWTERESNPHPPPSRESRFQLRYRPVVAGAGIEPARRAYETPLIARSPALMG